MSEGGRLVWRGVEWVGAVFVGSSSIELGCGITMCGDDEGGGDVSGNGDGWHYIIDASDDDDDD